MYVLRIGDSSMANGQSSREYKTEEEVEEEEEEQE